MNVDDAPFYLTCVLPNRLRDGAPWYYNTPMGANSLGQLLKRACQEAGVSGKKTNHSLRKTCVKELSKAGIQDHQIVKITGHKNVSSLVHYDQELDLEDHENISAILCRRNKSSTATLTSMNASVKSTRPMSLPLDTTMNRNVCELSQQNITQTVTENQSFETVNNPFPGIFHIHGVTTFNNCTFNLSSSKE